ncbi:MAG: ATP-binding protein [Bacillota bacterium]
MANVLELKQTDDVENEDPKAWLNRQIKERGIPLTSFARDLGVSHTMLSLYLRGKKDSKSIEGKVREMMSKEAQGAPKSDPPAHPEEQLFITRDFQQALAICDMCRQEGEIGLLIGHPGSGKTTVLTEYCKRDPEAVFIRARATMTAKEMLYELGTKLGLTLSGGQAEMERKIITQLKEYKRLVIFDEADFLITRESTKRMNILRSIWDETRTGMVFSGTPDFAEDLVKGPSRKENLSQFYSRVRWAYRMKGVSRQEAQEILAGYNITDAAKEYMIKRACDKARGGLRRFKRLLQNALDLAQGEQITMEIVEEADDLLLSPDNLGIKL